MIRFECDYTESAHKKIITRLAETIEEQHPGYGTDTHCRRAADMIKLLCGSKDADVHFLVGGTQTNTTVIASILKPYQGVVAVDTGHINVHETGAIEATGHKVIPLMNVDGKLKLKQLEEVYESHYTEIAEHMVQPGMVYISQPTENGSLYSKNELTEISDFCKRHNLPLFIDGARLGYALAATKNDVTLPELAGLCDVFYIGGTKVGALFGEAVVIMNPALKKDFRYHIKQRGGMLAKGWLLGLQFEVLFEDGLYFEISQQAVEQAMKIKEAFTSKGYKLLYDSYTNQQFPILPTFVMKMFEEKYSFSYWLKVDDNKHAVRFCTSWATKDDDVAKLIADIPDLQ